MIVLPDAKVRTPDDWLDHVEYWQAEYDHLVKRVERVGIGNAGEEVVRRLFAMQGFVSKTSDILALVADTLQPRLIDAIEELSFDD